MEKGGGGRYEDAEQHGRDGYGQATVEEAHILFNPFIRNKWMLNKIKVVWTCEVKRWTHSEISTEL